MKKLLSILSVLITCLLLTGCTKVENDIVYTNKSQIYYIVSEKNYEGSKRIFVFDYTESVDYAKKSWQGDSGWCQALVYFNNTTYLYSIYNAYDTDKNMLIVHLQIDKRAAQKEKNIITPLDIPIHNNYPNYKRIECSNGKMTMFFTTPYMTEYTYEFVTVNYAKRHNIEVIDFKKYVEKDPFNVNWG